MVLLSLHFSFYLTDNAISFTADSNTHEADNFPTLIQLLKSDTVKSEVRKQQTR